MPQITVPDGETKELYSGDRGDAVFINTDSEILVDDQEMYAHNGLPIQADNPGVFELKRNGEAIYAFANGADANVDVRRQGFAIELFGKEVFEITNQVSTDIVAQSVGNVASDTARVSAESVTEVNADQTQTVSNGDTQTTIVNASSGELWELKTLEINVENTSGSNAHLMEVRTEAQNAEIAFASSSSGAAFDYQSGGWVGGTTTRGDGEPTGTIIDDTNGIEFHYDNQTGADQTDARNIRISFGVLNV